MTFLEFLDRRAERQAQHPRRPRDIRQFIGFAFLVGYYVMVYQFTRGELPKENVDLIRDAMLTLGPPIGIIIGAMFRTDAREEQATENTAKAFEAIKETAAAGASTTGTPENPTVIEGVHGGETVTIKTERKK